MRLRFPITSLFLKIFLALTGLAFIVAAGASLLLYRSASSALRNEVREHLKAIAATTASQINQSQHDSIHTSADETSSAYLNTKSMLESVRKANPAVRFIYTMRKSSKPDVWQFVVDSESDPKLMSHVGDEYDVSKLTEMKRSFSGPTADNEPSNDQWGWYISGYAPITAKNGRTDAIVGVDMSIDQLRKEESTLRHAAVVNTGYAFLIAALLALIAARTVMPTLERFIRAAQRVRNGDLEFSLPLMGSVEIKNYTEAFNEMITGLKESRQRILEGSSRDFLTGLYNHMYLHEHLEIEVQRAARYNHKACLIMIDLDRFKSINDTLGHPIGDSIIHQLATVLRANLRDVDIPVRYGGDEFAVIMPETDKESGLAVAERLRANVEAYNFSAVPLNKMMADKSTDNSDKVIHITVTIGLACCPDHHATKDGLIMAADIALCQAKHISRNRVTAYEGAGSSDEIDPHKLYQMLHDPNSAAVASLAAAVDAKDRYTSGHSERVAAYAQEIAGAMDADQETIDLLKIAGLLHDLGKIGVPDAVLNKPGSLTTTERENINQHPALGGNILKRAPQLDQVIPTVIFHHERWDGQGYPNGLAGEQIPQMARIMAIADAFDAMTSDRPYRKAMSIEAALLELQAGAGKQFDPDIVELFISNMQAKAQKDAA